jgi:hypothetical protein
MNFKKFGTILGIGLASQLADHGPKKDLPPINPEIKPKKTVEQPVDVKVEEERKIEEQKIQKEITERLSPEEKVLKDVEKIEQNMNMEAKYREIFTEIRDELQNLSVDQLLAKYNEIGGANHPWYADINGSLDGFDFMIKDYGKMEGEAEFTKEQTAHLILHLLAQEAIKNPTAAIEILKIFTGNKNISADNLPPRSELMANTEDSLKEFIKLIRHQIVISNFSNS